MVFHPVGQLPIKGLALRHRRSQTLLQRLEGPVVGVGGDGSDLNSARIADRRGVDDERDKFAVRGLRQELESGHRLSSQSPDQRPFIGDNGRPEGA
jgi:hypothetical protein